MSRTDAESWSGAGAGRAAGAGAAGTALGAAALAPGVLARTLAIPARTVLVGAVAQGAASFTAGTETTLSSRSESGGAGAFGSTVAATVAAARATGACDTAFQPAPTKVHANATSANAMATVPFETRRSAARAGFFSTIVSSSSSMLLRDTLA